MTFDCPSALQPNLKSAKADRMVIGVATEAATTPGSLAAYEGLTSAIGNFLWTHERVDRFSTIDRHLGSAKMWAAAFKVQTAAAMKQDEDSEM